MSDVPPKFYRVPMIYMMDILPFVGNESLKSRINDYRVTQRHWGESVYMLSVSDLCDLISGAQQCFRNAKSEISKNEALIAVNRLIGIRNFINLNP